MTEPNQKSATAADNPSRSRRWLRICLGALVVILLLIAFLPRIGAAWMRKSIQTQLSEETGLSVTLGSLSAGWFSGISITDLTVRVPSGNDVVAIDNLSTQKGLLGLITRGKEVGEIYIERPAITIDLGSSMMEELKTAVASMDTTQGILKVIADPEKDALVGLRISECSLSVKTETESEWQHVTNALAVAVDLDREGPDAQLDVRVPQSPIRMSPVLCDHGLQFVAPVLSRALALDGECSLAIDHCRLRTATWQEMELNGTLTLHTVNAEVDGPVIQRITGAIAQISTAADESDNPASPPTLNLQVADQSAVQFSVLDGVVHHEGFAFGLPKVLPSLVLTTSGDVGFDSSLDLEVKAALPFDRMGDSGLLQKMGAPSFTVPVGGNLDEPEVDAGEGKVLGRFVRELVLNATDNEVDPAPMLKKLSESGLLSRLRKREEDTTAADEGIEISPGALNDILKRFERPDEGESFKIDLPFSEHLDTPDSKSSIVDPSETQSPEKESRGGLLKRLRERRQNRE